MQTNYYRVPAVMFAVLVGGIFVYAKSGGRFFAPAKLTPASESGENDPSLPRIEFMAGSKSAPAFVPEAPSVQAEARQLPSSTLLPGSKSAIVVSPESLVPAPTNTVPHPAEPSRRLLPGSKSIILVDPSTLQPPANQAAPVQPARPQQQGADR